MLSCSCNNGFISDNSNLFEALGAIAIMTALPAVIDVGIEAIHGIDDAITVDMGKNRSEARFVPSSHRLTLCSRNLSGLQTYVMRRKGGPASV